MIRPIKAGLSLPVPHRPILAAAETKLLVTTRPQLAVQLDMVARFVALCRRNGIKLTVATTPLRGDHATLYDPADLRDVVERLSRVVPVWDFSSPDWLAWDPQYWDDSSHFKPAVGAMMLERMYAPQSAAPSDFGILRDARRATTSALH
jgi:hypothetical protein